MQNNNITLVIIAFNEANNIVGCIESAKALVDEILVIDSFSTDNTVDLAKSAGAKVIQHAFEGHIQQKNWAKNQATTPWVLSLDADEQLSPVLLKNLLFLKSHSLGIKSVSGYTFNRLNHLAGQPIKGCGWYPDTKLRLWLKDDGNWAGSNPHDKFILAVDTHFESIEGDILHFTYETHKAMRNQAIKFGKIGGMALRDSWGNPTVGITAAIFWKAPLIWFVFLTKFLVSGWLRFFRNYLFKKGFLYGWNGFQICFWQLIEVEIKYAVALWGSAR